MDNFISVHPFTKYAHTPLHGKPTFRWKLDLQGAHLTVGRFSSHPINVRNVS